MSRQSHHIDKQLQARRWVEMLLEDCGPDEKLDQIVKDAAILFKVPIAMINLLGPEVVVFKACVGQIPGDCLERDGSFCDAATSQDTPFSIVDASKDERFRDYVLVTNELHIRSYLGKSLHAPNGARIGTMCLLDSKPRRYSTLNQNVLCELAESVEKAIARMISYQSVEAEPQQPGILMPLPVLQK